MGRMKDLLIEMQEWSYELHLAKILGISLDDLLRLEWDIESEENDDGLSYGHHVVFSEKSPKTILSKIGKLQSDNTVYLQPGELEQVYGYNELFELIRHDNEYVKRYKDELINLERLLKVDIDDETVKATLHRHVFIGVISTMETFLSDAFINITFDKPEYFRNFVETHPEFKKRKFELREIFIESDKIQETAKRIMLDTIYHNLPTIQRMYQETFKIKFPKISEVYKYVEMRHDLVHRNGKTKDGEIVNTDESAIIDLIHKIDDFIREVMRELRI